MRADHPRNLPPDGLLEVGRVGRPHGIRGDVFVDLTSDRVERAAVGSRLWVQNDWREVIASAPAGERWRVHLAGVDDRNTAQLLTGSVVYAEPIDDPDALWVHRLIGSSVVDSAGRERGICVAVIDNPAADLLELDSGALVPANFIVSVDDEPKPTTNSGAEPDVDASAGRAVIRVAVPDGLFELFDDEDGQQREHQTDQHQSKTV